MLILLIGPKGSGKSHIGRLLEAANGIHFFHVEPYWMRYHADCATDGRKGSIAEGIERVHPAIVNALQLHKHVCVETTGASPEILEDLLSLGELVPILLVKVEAPLSVCLERIVSRNATNQIPVEEETIRQIYELSLAVELPFDITIENTSLSESEILRPFTEHGAV